MESQNKDLKQKLKNLFNILGKQDKKEFRNKNKELLRLASEENKINFGKFYCFYTNNLDFYSFVANAIIPSVGDRILYSKIAEVLDITIKVFEIIETHEFVSYFNPSKEKHQLSLNILLIKGQAWVIYNENILNQPNPFKNQEAPQIQNLVPYKTYEADYINLLSTIIQINEKLILSIDNQSMNFYLQAY